SITGATGTVLAEPTAGQPSGPGNDQLQIDFGSVTGQVVVTFDFHIAAFAAGATDPVLGTASGDQAPVTNAANLTADWDPLDPRDPNVAVDETVLDTFQASSLAIQKGAVVDTNVGPAAATPGDIYTFTLDVQVSDFFTYGDLVITDVLGNGWEFVANSATFTTVEEGQGIGAATSLDPFQTQNVNGSTGETTTVWDLSAAMASVPGADGLLTGTAADGAPTGSNTTATITYRAQILDQFTPDGSLSDPEISQGDVLSNDVTIAGTVRDNTAPATVLGTEENASGSEVAIPFGQVEVKEVYAVNGVVGSGQTTIAAGDAITFRVAYNAPIGSFEGLRITDNLPLDVFSATELTTFNAVSAATPPAVGEAQFGPGDDLFALTGAVPTVTTDAPNNGISFGFGDFSLDPRGELTVEFLYTVSVEDVDFVDEILLTNQVTAFENNTQSPDPVDSTVIARFTYAEPVLDITKGVIATSSTDPDVTFTAPKGPVAFTAPGSAGARFSGTIDSAGLAATAVDANVENIDAGDVVSFAVVVENTGSAPNGAFNVVLSDTIPAGFVVPTDPADLNLSVTDGTGASIAFTGSALDFFTPGGIELIDGAGSGSIGAFDATSGENVVVVTYDLVAAQSVAPGDDLVNTATLSNFTAREGGPGDVPLDRTPTDLTDAASAEVKELTVTKTPVGREFGTAGTGDVLIGEEFTFLVRIDVPEGSYTDVTLRDTVRSGGNFTDYEILGAQIVTWDSAALTSSEGVANGTVGTVAADGNSVSFDVGTLTNAGDNDTGNDFIEFTVTARSLGSDPVAAGDRLANTAGFESDQTTVIRNNGVNAAEANVAIDKGSDATLYGAGDTVTYTVVLTNPAQPNDAPAYDLVLTDLLADPNIALVPGSVTAIGAPATIVTGNGGTDTTIQVTADALEIGQTLTVTYEALIADDVEAGIEIDNTADVTYDSLPTDDADDERDYAAQDSHTVATIQPGIDKGVFATDFGETAGADLAVGEIVTYEITLTIPEGETSDAVLTDILPTSPGTLTFVSSEVVSIGADIQGAALAVGAGGTNSGATTTFDFGDLFNPIDGVQDAEDEIVVRISARLDDLVGNADGAGLVNTATLTSEESTVTDTANVSVVIPELDLDKTATPATGDAGDTIDFRIESENVGTGPAYDIVIDDPLTDPNLVANAAGATIVILDSGGGPVTLPPADAPSVVYPTAGGGLQATIPVLDVGQTIRIDFQAVVQDGAAFAASVDNTATVTRFDTNPADTPPAGQERVFAGPSDAASVATPAPDIAKTVVATDNPQTGGTSVAISETITYEIVLDLPEGTSALILTDDLPEGLTPVSATVMDLAANVTANVAQGDTDASSGFITIGPDGGYRIDFGTVTVPGDNDPTNDSVTVTVQARVTDTAGVTAGADRTNVATLAIVDPGTGTPLTDGAGNPLTYSDDATVTVVEPAVTVAKAATPTTADAGDVVAFEIRTDNTGGAPAYDMLLEDDLAAGGLTGDAGSLSIAILRGAVDETPTGADAPTLTLGGDGILRASIPVLENGQTLVIGYDATVADDTLFSTEVTNTATVTRFDSDPAGDGADPDNGRVFGPVSDTATVVSEDVVIAKDFVGTDNPDTLNQDVTIGEAVTYRITLTLPQGQGALDVVDAVPDGLTALSARVVSFGTGTTATTLSPGDDQDDPGIAIGAAGDSVSFDFGTVTVAGEDDAAATDTEIVLEITARVVDVPAATTAPGSDALVNSVTVSVTDPSDPSTDLQPDATATETVTVVEPNLTIDKDAALIAEPGDPVDYTVTIVNTGDGPAYDLLLVDPLSEPRLDFNLTPFQVMRGGTDITGTAAAAFTATATGFELRVDELAVGETLTVTYTATLDPAAELASSFVNTASLQYDTVPDGDPDSPTARSYAASDDASVATVPFLQKDVASTSDPATTSTAGDPDRPDLLVGEEVTYTLTVTLPEIAMNSVVVSDTLPTGLSLVSVVVDPVDPGITGTDTRTITTSAQSFTVDFGDVTNASDGSIGPDDAFTITLVARVDDVAAVTDGAVLTNTADLDVTAGDGTVLNTVTATAAIDIVEPALSVDKTGPLAADPGDTITYTATIANTGSGPAHDVQVTDALGDPALSLVSGTVDIAVDGAAVSPPVTASGSGFQFVLPTLAPGEVLTVTYDVLVDAGATSLASLPNTVGVVFDTVPDGDPNSPTGRSESVDDTFNVFTGPTLDKAVSGTSNPDTGDGAFTALADLLVGETVDFDLTITLPETAFDSLVLVDNLPPGLELVSATPLATGANVTATGTSNAPVPTVSSAGPQTTFTFGPVTNAADGVADADDIITLRVTARVVDIAGVDAGDVLTNEAVLTATPAGGPALDPQSADASVEVVEPVLTIDKTGPVGADPGDTIDYAIALENTGSGPAYDVLIADALADPALSLVSGTVQVQIGATVQAVTVTETGAGFELTLPALQPGETATVTYQAVLDAAADPLLAYDNTATAQFDTVPGTDPAVPGRAGGPISDTQTLSAGPTLTKATIATDNAGTGTAAGDAAAPDLAIGEAVTYELVLTLPELAMGSVVLTDTLPAGLTLQSATVTAIGADLSGASGVTDTGSGQTVTFDFGAVTNAGDGTIDADDRIVVQVVATVDDAGGPVAGDALTNAATLAVTPAGGPAYDPVAAAATVDIVEPDLTIEKSAPVRAGPGDRLDYTVRLENQGGAPAYDVLVSDGFADPNLAYVPGSISATLDGVDVTASAVVVEPAGGGVTLRLDEVPADAVLEVAFQADLSPATPSATVVANTASVDYDVTPDGNPNGPGRSYDGSDDHEVVTVPIVEKAFVGSDVAETGSDRFDPTRPDLNPGEQATYSLTLVLPETDMDAVVLRDVLPAGLTYLSGSVTSVGAGLVLSGPTSITNDDSVTTFDFGAISNPVDGSIGADDEIVVEIVAVVGDVAAGTVLQNDAALDVRVAGVDLDTAIDSASVEVVRPDITVDKVVSNDSPAIGDTVTYTVTLTNAEMATGSAFNLVVSDALPADLTLVGTPRPSNGLGTVTTTGMQGFVVSVPLLQPGETVQVEYDVLVGPAGAGTVGLVNTADVAGSTTPGTSHGIALATSDDATLTVIAPGLELIKDFGVPDLGIDDAQFIPVLTIDPIYSGTAEPGSNVTVSLFAQDGELLYVRNMLADAGGHWIATFPRTELEPITDDFNEFFDDSRIIKSPVLLLDGTDTELLRLTVPGDRTLVIGTDLAEEAYTIGLDVDRPATMGDDVSTHNSRVFYAPALNAAAFARGEILRVDEVFENVADTTVRALYEASV
ncbi:MAG: isopeptide-forming domain-containing fimbrial protein, partial [Pseudomonadota bacterium]